MSFNYLRASTTKIIKCILYRVPSLILYSWCCKNKKLRYSMKVNLRSRIFLKRIANLYDMIWLQLGRRWIPFPKLYGCTYEVIDQISNWCIQLKFIAVTDSGNNGDNWKRIPNSLLFYLTCISLATNPSFRTALSEFIFDYALWPPPTLWYSIPFKTPPCVIHG